MYFLCLYKWNNLFNYLLGWAFDFNWSKNGLWGQCTHIWWLITLHGDNRKFVIDLNKTLLETFHLVTFLTNSKISLAWVKKAIPPLVTCLLPLMNHSCAKYLRGVRLAPTKKSWISLPLALLKIPAWLKFESKYVLNSMT